MRDSIVLYRSTIEASRTLGEKARLKFLDALFDYAMDDKNTELTGNSKIFFDLTKPLIDANNKKFTAGKRGGRPPKDDKNFYGEYKNVYLDEKDKKTLENQYGSAELVAKIIEQLSAQLEQGNEKPYDKKRPHAHFERMKAYIKYFKEHPTGKQGFKSAADKKSDAIESALRGIK